MRCAPPAGRGFSPLDEALALRPGRYSPYVQQCVVRLGTWLPFEQVPEALSYFSRLADADTFRRLAWVETHRRGVTVAPRVCAVVDGAEWCQTFLTRHCPDAVRILDFPHAAGYVSAAAQAMFGPGSPEASE